MVLNHNERARLNELGEALKTDFPSAAKVFREWCAEIAPRLKYLKDNLPNRFGAAVAETQAEILTPFEAVVQMQRTGKSLSELDIVSVRVLVHNREQQLTLVEGFSKAVEHRGLPCEKRDYTQDFSEGQLGAEVRYPLGEIAVQMQVRTELQEHLNGIAEHINLLHQGNVPQESQNLLRNLAAWTAQAEARIEPQQMRQGLIDLDVGSANTVVRKEIEKHIAGLSLERDKVQQRQVQRPALKQAPRQLPVAQLIWRKTRVLGKPPAQEPSRLGLGGVREVAAPEPYNVPLPPKLLAPELGKDFQIGREQLRAMVFTKKLSATEQLKFDKAMLEQRDEYIKIANSPKMDFSEVFQRLPEVQEALAKGRALEELQAEPKLMLAAERETERHNSSRGHCRDLLVIGAERFEQAEKFVQALEGPALELVSKMHVAQKRHANGGAPLLEKEVQGVAKMLRSTPTKELADRFERLLAVEIAAAHTKQAIRYLHAHFIEPDGQGHKMDVGKQCSEPLRELLREMNRRAEKQGLNQAPQSMRQASKVEEKQKPIEQDQRPKVIKIKRQKNPGPGYSINM